jgi:hypothetical protein
LFDFLRYDRLLRLLKEGKRIGEEKTMKMQKEEEVTVRGTIFIDTRREGRIIYCSECP